MTYTETDLAASIERLTGDEVAALTQHQRDQLDQFHSGGAQAVDRLLPSLRLESGMTVLDVGSGLGGPARQVARTAGCTVIGIDITPAYIEAALSLTYWAGLAEQVRFFHTDIANYDRVDFDAAYTMHVQMNVADKKSFFAEIARHLRPGSPFATFEVCRTADAESSLPLPLPWSLDGTDSFLSTGDELCETIESSGFHRVEWVDETPWIREWFEDLGSRATAPSSNATLPALLYDGPRRMFNFASAIFQGELTIHRGAFTLAR
jgi:sarcosine/dimethylglycine N-methyltransferase